MLSIPTEIKELYKRNSVKKNLRIHFPNGERADIVNDKIVAESFSFTESLCSQSTLKFGLCEASVVEFECVGIGNIKGYEIAVFHEIDISSLSEDFIAEYGMTSNDVGFPFYQIPYGVFVVDECPRQSDMKKRRVVAYTKEVNWDTTLNSFEQGRQWLNKKYNLTNEVDVFKYSAGNGLVNKSYLGSMVDWENVVTAGSAGDWSDTAPIGYSIFVGVFGKRYVINNFNELNNLFYIENDYIENHIAEGVGSALENFINKWEKQYTINYSDSKEAFIERVKNLIHPVVSYKDLNEEVFIKDNNKFLYPYIKYNADTEDVYIEMPCYINFYLQYYETYGGTPTDIANEKYNFKEDSKIYLVDTSEYPSISYISNEEVIHTKKIFENYLEIEGLFGKYNRFGEPDFFKLDFGVSLYPSESLYPSNDLFPNVSNNGLITRTNYMSAWYDENPTKPYGRVSVTYINKNNEKVFEYYPIVDDATYSDEVYQTYSLADNFLIQKCTFTAEQIAEILETVATNIRNVHYTPSEIELIGRPDIEAGNVVQVITKDGGFETIVLERTLSGIQSLTDNFDARG